MTGLLPDELGRIDDARDVHVSQETTLDKLLEIGERFVANYASFFFEYNSLSHSELNTRYDEIYNGLNGLRKKLMIRNITFTDNDLKEFIFTKANSDYGHEGSVALGIFTGMLLQFLAEINREQGKETAFYINGNGQRFPYLFYFAKNVGKIIVEDFTGESICGCVGYNSYAKQMIGINISGDNNLSHIGCRGRVGQIIGVHLKGMSALSGIGSNKGRVNQVGGIDIEGDNVFDYCGRYSGKINQLLGYGIKGDCTLSQFGTTSSHVNQALVIYIEGNYTLGNFEEKNTNNDSIRGRNGQINQVFGAHLRGKDIFNCLGLIPLPYYPYHCPVKQLVYLDVDGRSESMKAREIISGERAKLMYEQMLKENHVEEIVALARSMQGKPEEEIFRIADELYKLKPAVPASFFERK